MEYCALDARGKYGVLVFRGHLWTGGPTTSNAAADISAVNARTELGLQRLSDVTSLGATYQVNNTDSFLTSS